jgi:hypothetical protein
MRILKALLLPLLLIGGELRIISHPGAGWALSLSMSLEVS